MCADGKKKNSFVRQSLMIRKMSQVFCFWESGYLKNIYKRLKGSKNDLGLFEISGHKKLIF